MSRATRLFSKPAVPAPDAVNRDGFPSYTQPKEHDFVQTLLTNTLGNTFYVERGTLVAEAQEVHREMVKADPELAAKAIVYARNNGFMRTQPLLALAHLSAASPAWFRRAFDGAVRTPNDLRDLTVMVQSLRERERTFTRTPKGREAKTVTAVTRSEGGASVKKAASRWLSARLTEFWAIKYGSDRRARPTIWDMVRMYHPRLSPSQLPVLSYLKDGSVTDASATPQIAALERLKRATTDDERIEAIRAGKLPHEVATSFAGSSKAVWAAILEQMPVFALLRHLSALERHGVLEEARGEIERKLQNADVVRRSKILPYRFLEAEKHVKAGWARDALRDALELSFGNVPDIPGVTSVLLDCSPSMKPGYRRDGFMEIASIFAVALMKKGGLSGSLVCFDGVASRMPISLRDSTLTQARTVAAWGTAGGTNPSAALDELLEAREKADNLIVITDGEQNQGRPFAQALAEYRERVKRDVKTFVLDVSPYRNAITASDPTVLYVYGWSDRALDFIAMAASGWGSIVSRIRETALAELKSADVRHED